MSEVFEQVPVDIMTDMERNRIGRLSKRQWIELTTEPLVTLLLLSTPVILLLGANIAIAGRWIFLGLIAVLGITMLVRATRFARVKLHYQILYAEQTHPRWQFWRKITLIAKTGEPVCFDHHIVSPLHLQNEHAYLVYFIDVAGSKTLVSLAPARHPKADKWQPLPEFSMRGGVQHS